ncbi:helicase [Erythrobacteraceae bacterium CFH 75059]|nr:helicase [Erythrobacteraceae bacterium CFH 75059]
MQAHLRAVLGPTNTGKTHLAIERMCAHSSGVIGFPLRLLAQEVYARLVALKGERQVALVTGEQRIEPPDARYVCCTVEAMPASLTAGERQVAFVALDEAQLAADPERGHVFTDRLLHARGREETMVLGSATLAAPLRRIAPKVELVERPRFSTLRHLGPRKLSRLPPRSAIVAFSAEQVYGVAETLRRYRGGAAVVMGALSPETRNRQVELFQSGEVQYIVATDAIGMGLNLDIDHVAFAGLSKFDGRRRRRLTPAEIAQIAGRAGRHQRDGTFGVLSGYRDGERTGAEFTEEEIYSVEEHRFAPLPHLFWRNGEPRFDTLQTLIGDLEQRPEHSALAPAPEALDLAVLKHLAGEPWAQSLTGHGAVRAFWEVCSLPDFRQQGLDTHARFVARLWRDLRQGYLGADYVAARIAELDNTQGDIDTLQGRIAAIRSWAYICQRPDWVLAREEMAARARAAETRLSDALHARLTERFVNRRTSVLLRSMTTRPELLPVRLSDDGTVLIDDELLGRLHGFTLHVEAAAGLAERRMRVAAAEKALPHLLARRVDALIAQGLPGVHLRGGRIWLDDAPVADLDHRGGRVVPRVRAGSGMTLLSPSARERLLGALQRWLEAETAALAPLQGVLDAASDPGVPAAARAAFTRVASGFGHAPREGLVMAAQDRQTRAMLRRHGVHLGALDLFMPALLKPRARRLLHELGLDPRPTERTMPPVLAGPEQLFAGYRAAGSQLVRVDVAERLIRAAHDARAASRGGRPVLDRARAISAGLTEAGWHQLLQQAGFRLHRGQGPRPGAAGPPQPDRWSWRPQRRATPRRENRAPRPGNAFAALETLVQ